MTHWALPGGQCVFQWRSHMRERSDEDVYKYSVPRETRRQKGKRPPRHASHHPPIGRGVVSWTLKRHSSVGGPRGLCADMAIQFLNRRLSRYEEDGAGSIGGCGGATASTGSTGTGDWAGSGTGADPRIGSAQPAPPSGFGSVVPVPCLKSYQSSYTGG